MPSFAERESSILSSILQKKKPPSEMGSAAKEEKTERQAELAESYSGSKIKAVMNQNDAQAAPTPQLQNSAPSNQSIDLLGKYSIYIVYK